MYFLLSNIDRNFIFGILYTGFRFLVTRCRVAMLRFKLPVPVVNTCILKKLNESVNRNTNTDQAVFGCPLFQFVFCILLQDMTNS